MKTEESLCVKTPIRNAEKIRKSLYEKNIIRTDLKINKDEKYIYIPIKDDKKIKKLEITKKNFEINNTKIKSYKDKLSLPKNIQFNLPTSYDVIGDIILIKIPDKLQKYKKLIGEALIKTNKQIKTVYQIHPVSGEKRTRKIEIIAGEKQTKTIHKEYGLIFNVDVEKVYFSPRLANERKHIASLVQPGEKVVDMFAGVAPFSIMIAKYANPKIVYAVDKNEEAVKLARENIKINRVVDKVEVILNDAGNIHKILDVKKVKADRVIMNLPFNSHLFFQHALEIANDNCVIHDYIIINENKIYKQIKNLEKIAHKNNFVLVKTNIRKIKQYSPREFYICVDITAKKKDADVA